MKRIALILVILVAVAGISFAQVTGSTAAGVIGNADEKRIEVDQVIDIDLFDAALHFDLDFGFDKTFDKRLAYDYTVGASYAFSVFKVGTTAAANRNLKLGDVTLWADIVLGPVGADVDFLFSGDPVNKKDRFRGADFSMFYNPGPFEFRVGYLFTDNGAPDINAPELLSDGGIYAKAKLSY